MRCQVSKCGARAVAKSLCDKHRKRFARHGHLDETRPNDWGKREKHALYGTWKWIAKRTMIGVTPEWDDFWRFAKDVGERPDGHFIRQLDGRKPYGPGNFFWKPTSPSEDRAKYAREWRKRNPLAAKGSDLKKSFGLSVDDYFEMLAAQDDKCAICGTMETGDRNKYFAVDHCHKTKRIRGLLCNHCNRAIGLLKDSPTILRAAVEYLEKARGVSPFYGAAKAALLYL